ncbi:MAG: hypothetical protein WD052_03340 [Bacteroidales bacterium]
MADMKKFIRTSGILVSLVLFSLSTLYSQAPTGLSYQAVARDSEGNALSNMELTVRIAIKSETAGGETFWQEDHDVTTNQFGLFSINIGGPDGYGQAGSAGSFSGINWSGEQQYYLNVMVRKDTEFLDMGGSILQRIPFAQSSQYAQSAENAATSQFAESAQTAETAGTALFAENAQSAVTAQSAENSNTAQYAETAQTAETAGSALFAENANTAVVADTALYAKTAQSAETARQSSGNFSVLAEQEGALGEALFEVKRSDGSVAFAVYEDMVWVYADNDLTKGIKGGFAVGGYNASKADPQEYLRVTPDSIRMYINEENTAKGAKGGFAVGGYNSAKGIGAEYLHVAGNNLVQDDYSIALGVDAVASGNYSTAIGYQSIASGSAAFSAGRTSLASSNNTIAIGNGTKALSTESAAIGYRSEARGEKSIAIGSYYNYSFSYLPYFNLAAKNDPKGDFIIYDPIIKPIFRTISFNRANIAEGKYSISLGNGNYSNNGGMALGSNNDAIGFGASALGVSNKALNTNSFAAGFESRAEGFYSTAFGNNVLAKSYGSFVVGQYNVISGDSTEWVEYDPLFVVANGLNADNRNNALTIYKNGRSIFKGSDANLTLNDRRIFFSLFPSFSTFLNVYGVRSYINCSDPAVDNYYSGYFFKTGTEVANYRGLYADTRAGASIDVAEYIYDTHGNTEAGDVLVADPGVKESVILSGNAYQSSVVGIVSTKPHMVMGMELVIDEVTGSSLPGVQATRLALTGRVPCKVTDENGPVKPGDLLTTSSTPGHAMKWTPLDVNQAKDFEELKKILEENEMRRHAVIGKALEEHKGGTGKIMVLVSLQ